MKLLWGVSVAGALAAAIALVVSGCGTSTGTAQSTPRPTVTVTVAGNATPSASPAVTATLPVRVLPTDGSLGVETAPLYPAAVTVRLPSSWVGKVAAYGVVGVVLLAPTKWTEGDSSMGADGSRYAMLHATKASPVAGRIEYQLNGTGIALQDAAPYFPWLRAEWDQNPYDRGSSPPSALPGLVEHFAGDQLAEYQLTSGQLVKDGLQVNGVAHTTAAPRDLGVPSFDCLEVALPPSDHGLATAILNDYLSPASSVDSGVSSTLQTYFAYAINGHDYGSYVSCFTSQQRQLLSAGGFTKDFSTTHDGDIVIHGIRMTGPDRAVARVTFTSTQDPSQGRGYARLSWTLTYTMKLVGWQWLIANVAGSPKGIGAVSASPMPAASPTTASDIINWSQAIDYVGHHETVQGPVVSTDFAQDSNDEPTFLNVGLDYPDSGRLSVVIWFENRSNFPQAPEVMYSDKTIRVTGLVTTYEGCAQIEATSPDDIEIVP